MAISGALAVARQGGFSAIRRETERALGRLRVGIWPVVQTAVAAALAWSVAVLVLGHQRPFVAAIAAVISIGAVNGQTLRRAAEWIFGVAVGLAVADLIMLAIGTGPVQTGVIVCLAMAAALLMRGGAMFVTEAGVSAVLVVNLDPTDRKSTRLNSSHANISYAVFCLKKKKTQRITSLHYTCL